MKLWLLFLVSFFVWAQSYADDAASDAYRRKTLADLPGHAVPLFGDSETPAFHTFAHDDDTAVFGAIDTPDRPFAKALRIEVKKPTSPAWNVVIASRTNPLAVKKGDVLFIAFEARCTASAAETGGGHIFATLEQLQTYKGLGCVSACPGKQWTRFYLRVVAPSDYPAKNLECAFHLGSYAQTIEIGGFVAANLGPGVDLKQLPFTRISYEGQAPDAPWRQKALTRIENIRKGDLVVRVLNSGGAAETNAAVHVRLTRHAYSFGTFIEDSVLKETPDGRKYRETACRLFNRATCPIYWTDWGRQNPTNRLTYLAIAQWAKANGFSMRGHNLIWPGWRWMPSEARALKDDPAALRKLIDDHLDEVVTEMKPFGLDVYDVVNEPRVNHDVQDLLGPGEIAHWYERVHNLDPKPVLGINEFSIVSGGGDTEVEQTLYAQQIRSLQEVNAPLGAIGVQCHMGDNLTPPQKVLDILDRLATLRLPIEATEFDIAIDDEQTQGDYMRDFLIAFFSHPSTQAITQWGFWAGQHWIPRAALFDKDWRVKPAGQAYMDWVLGTWWTDETRRTDHEGFARIRGFLGDYDVVVTYPGGRTVTRTVRVVHDGALLTIKP